MVRLLRKHIVWMLLAGSTGVAALILLLDFSFSRDFEGIYLLRSATGKGVALSNTLYLGEEERYLWGIDLLVRPVMIGNVAPSPLLTLDWNESAGVGYLRNDLGDGTTLVTNFSRYLDSDGRHTRGLFVGGALPAVVRRENQSTQNASGMTWFDGTDWNHIWCNTNEGIGSTVSQASAAPSDWTFLDSRIVEQSAERVIVNSRHLVTLDGVPLRIEREVEAVAGRPYLQLEIKVSNVGTRPAAYFYYYGDEPWLGDFGSSAGDIGWLPDRLVLHEDTVDPLRYSYAGMADDGNDLLGEGHNFQHVANFIEWFGPDRPNAVFFANQYFGIKHDPRLRVPLFGNSRSLGMYWGPRNLAPGESRLMTLAIGMAQREFNSVIPKKPPVELHPHLAIN